MAPSPIDFYFDFASPYGYLASQRIDHLAARHGRVTRWRPIMLGPAMKLTGAQPLTSTGLKKAYTLTDMRRLAERWSIPLDPRPDFPTITLAAARAFYWLADDDPALAKRLAQRLLVAYWSEQVDIGPAEGVAEVAHEIGIDRAALLEAVARPEIKERLKAETEAAIARGVFGSPWVFVDDEPFWGFDKLDFVEHRLAAGH